MGEDYEGSRPECLDLGRYWLILILLVGLRTLR
jgi:hypothetical protein